MKFKPALLHFKFDNFASLPSEPEDKTYSEEETDCNGHKWKLILCPGGKRSNEKTGWISLYLWSVNKENLDARLTFTVKDANGATAKELQFERNFLNNSGTGYPTFMKRSLILDTIKNILKDGALCINVEIQVKDDADELFQPQNDHQGKLLALLKTGERSDASFTVGSRSFKVHSQIIYANSPILASSINCSIYTVHPDVFQLLLEYIYSGRVPSDKQIHQHGKGLIDASNRYELVQMKMFVENVLVRERILTKWNVSDYILFADAQCCPLLKEYAIRYFLMHRREVLKSECSQNLKESGELLSEIMMLTDPHDVDDGTEALTVNELRKELDKLNLDVDGSKDALVSRLEEAKRQPSQ